jgi:hypothetical protein
MQAGCTLRPRLSSHSSLLHVVGEMEEWLLKPCGQLLLLAFSDCCACTCTVLLRQVRVVEGWGMRQQCGVQPSAQAAPPPHTWCPAVTTAPSSSGGAPVGAACGSHAGGAPPTSQVCSWSQWSIAWLPEVAGLLVCRYPGAEARYAAEACAVQGNRRLLCGCLGSLVPFSLLAYACTCAHLNSWCSSKGPSRPHPSFRHNPYGGWWLMFPECCMHHTSHPQATTPAPSTPLTGQLGPAAHGAGSSASNRSSSSSSRSHKEETALHRTLLRMGLGIVLT